MADYKDILTQAISEALERMAFMDVGPFEPDLEPPDRTIFGQIFFSGPKSGVMQILTGHDFAQTVAENIGALDDVDETICADAVKELCNVICGLFLPLLSESPADVFDVTVPHAQVDADAPKWDQFAGEPDMLLVNVEGYPVAARVMVENTAVCDAIAMAD